MVPALMPVTTPVVISIEPADGILLLHVPGVVASLSVVVRPVQTVSVPVMEAGNGLTVTIAVMIQLVSNV